MKELLTDEYIQSIHSSALFKKSRVVVGRQVIFASSSEQLIDLIILPLPESHLDKQDQTETKTDFCVIEFESQIPGYSDYLTREPDRVIHDSNIGLEKLYYINKMIVIEHENIGTFFRFPEGSILIVIKDQSLYDQSGEKVNLTGLAIVLSTEIASRSGKLLIHGGGIATNGHCIVLTGESGAGKTTRVLDLSFRGYEFMGDDILILGKDSDGILKVWPYFLPIKVTYETSRMSTKLNKYTPKSRFDSKHIISVEKIPDIKKGAKSILDRIYFLTTEEEKRFYRLSDDEGFQYLSKTFFSFFTSEIAAFMLDNVLDIITTIPVYLISRGYINSIKEDPEKIFHGLH